MKRAIVFFLGVLCAAGQEMPRYRWENFTTAEGLPDNKVFCVAVDGERVWAGTDNGLGLYENGKWKVFRPEDGLAHRAVLSLAVDQETREVWAGTMGGLSRYSAGRFDNFTQLNSGLSNDVVYGVAVREDEVWTATAAGASRFNTRTGEWKLYNERNTPMFEIWTYAVSAAKDKVYYAVWGGGLLEYDTKTERWKDYNDPDGETEMVLFKDQGLIHEITTTVSYMESDRVVWAGTYFGASRYDGRNWRNFLEKDSGLPSNFMNQVKGLDGSRAWFSTDKGLAYYDGVNWAVYRPALDTGRPEMLVRDANGQVTRVDVNSAPAHHYTFGVDVQGGDIWVATAQGLSRGKGGQPDLSPVSAAMKTPPQRPAPREMQPYALTPEDLRPYGRFTTPYYEHYTKLVEYNGAAREAPDPPLETIDEVRIGFLGPIENHPDEALGRRMLNGALLAVEEANRAGGYRGKPFRLMPRNDQAVWGSSSNEIVKMAYDDKVWAIFGSISGDSTHIALRVTLRSEVPMVNSAATDPTIPETTIPWYLTVIQDDRVQCYTLARRIYTDLGLKRVALLRVNDRYGRFGVAKFRNASRRLGHPVVIEQKYFPGDTDFSRQLRVINSSRADAIVLWADAGPAAAILKQMRALGMQQRVFGSFRVLNDELLKAAGPAAEGLEAVFPYDPARLDAAFQKRFENRFRETPEAFASLAYDAMTILLESIRKAGLNRGRIRDALTSVEQFRGVTGAMTFDPNLKNVAPMFLAAVNGGRAEYRRYPMDKPYARVDEDKREFHGPAVADSPAGAETVVVFGPGAAVDSNRPWGQASTELIRRMEDPRTLAVIATESKAAHLALQFANKFFLPVVAITDDRTVTSTTIPWIFRLPAGTPLDEAQRYVREAAARAGANRQRIRDALITSLPGTAGPGGTP